MLPTPPSPGAGPGNRPSGPYSGALLCVSPSCPKPLVNVPQLKTTATPAPRTRKVKGATHIIAHHPGLVGTGSCPDFHPCPRSPSTPLLKVPPFSPLPPVYTAANRHGYCLRADPHGLVSTHSHVSVVRNMPSQPRLHHPSARRPHTVPGRDTLRPRAQLLGMAHSPGEDVPVASPVGWPLSSLERKLPGG